MAAPRENLLSLFHQTSTEPNTFTKQKERRVQRRSVFQDEFASPISQGHIRETQLQQRWLELKERESVAQQHNRQLLQQFEKAQDTLKDMLARNAAMKTIRMEYERYLEENTPRWHQQLQEKKQAAQKQKMEDCLRSYLNKTEEEEGVSHSALGLSTRPQKTVAPQANSIHEYSDYNQDGFSQHPYVQSSWLTQTQSQIGRIPIRVPAQRHSSTLLPPPNFHPHSFLLPHPTPMPGHHQPQPRQEAAEWASTQYSYPCSWATGAAGIPPGSWGQLYTEEPPLESRVSQTGRGEYEPGREVSSKREKSSGSSSSCLSQELDIKPVRLPSGHAESSESGGESRLTCREKRKKKEKRGRTQHSSSDGERCGSKESSRTSSEIVIASVTVAKSSERETSSEDNSTRSSGKTKRRGGLAVGSPRSETVAKVKQTEVKQEDPEGHNEESQSAGKESGSEEEKLENQSEDDKPESCRVEEEPGSDSIKSEKEKQESSSSEQSSTEKRDEEDSNVEEDHNDDEVSEKKNTTEVETAGEDEEDQGDGEQSKKRMNKETENRKHGSASSQEEDVDEDGSKSSEDEKEDEEEHGSENGEEENGDSEDSIISPQEKRSKQMQNIPEEAAEHDEENDGEETGSSKEVSDEDDIENLLAPREQAKEKEETEEKSDEKPQAICHNLEIFQATEDRSQTAHRSDSDEFDDFYD